MNQTASQGAQARKPGWSVPTEERMLTSADGTAIYATRRGQGELAVVVSHGFSGGHKHGSHARILGWFEAEGFSVFALDQRGHGRSGGDCTLAHFEPMDLDAVVAWARESGSKQVFTVGFSMGSATTLRHAALANPGTPRPELDASVVVNARPDGIVSVGGAGQWFYRGSRKMQGLHLLVGNSLGRWFLRERLGVRLTLDSWPAEHAPDRHALQPLDPVGCMRALAPTPALLVHGTRDDYFPVEHAERLFSAATQVPGHRTTLWVKQEMAHAESGTTAKLISEISEWIRAEAAVNQVG